MEKAIDIFGKEIEFDCMGCDIASHKLVPPGGYIYENVETSPGHKYSNWVVVKEASIFEDGEKYRICSVCDNKETVIIDRLLADPNDENFGVANITVLDSTTKTPIKNASITCKCKCFR